MRSPAGGHGSGDGWTTCGLGHRHWGLYGAAGLLLRRTPATPPSSGDVDEVLLQLRVGWSHHGGTWGIPGGARDAGETATQAALREAGEEADVLASAVRPEGVFVDDHGGWSYTTVVATSGAEVAARAVGPESTDVRWVPLPEVDLLSLHPGFAASWPILAPVGPSPRLVVDVANVMGSRPDGWWRDRAGAAARLRDELAAVEEWPDEVVAGWLDRVGVPGLTRRCPLLLVVEGAARSVAPTPGAEVIGASGSGDDAIVRVVADPAADPAGGLRDTVVVTADRELRRRVEALGARTVGPGSLLRAVGELRPS